MSRDFQKVMAQRTDDELIAIVSARKDEYNPEAIKAAQKELDSRNVDNEKFVKIAVEQEEIKRTEDYKAGLPLEKDAKLLAIFLPLGARLTYGRNLLREGYERKHAEFENAIFMGRLLYVGLIILLVVMVSLFR